MGDLINQQTSLYSLATNTFSPSGSKVYKDSSDEEGWAMLPNGQIVTYDLDPTIKQNTGFAEKYTPATGVWTGISPADGTASGTLPVLSSRALGFELGPILRLQGYGAGCGGGPTCHRVKRPGNCPGSSSCHAAADPDAYPSAELTR